MGLEFKSKEDLHNQLNGIAFVSTLNWVLFVSMVHISMILVLGPESDYFNDVGRQAFLVASAVLLTANVSCYIGNRRKLLLEITWLSGGELILFAIFIFESGKAHTSGQLGFALFVLNIAILMLFVFSSIRRGYEGKVDRFSVRPYRHSDRRSTTIDRQGNSSYRPGRIVR